MSLKFWPGVHCICGWLCVVWMAMWMVFTLQIKKTFLQLLYLFLIYCFLCYCEWDFFLLYIFCWCIETGMFLLLPICWDFYHENILYFVNFFCFWHNEFLAFILLMWLVYQIYWFAYAELLHHMMNPIWSSECCLMWCWILFTILRKLHMLFIRDINLCFLCICTYMAFWVRIMLVLYNNF